MEKKEKRCGNCKHLQSKHARPEGYSNMNDWDYYSRPKLNNCCCVKNCDCHLLKSDFREK